MTYPEFRSRQHSFSTPDGTLKYLDEGNGEPILLLHGVPTSGWLYRNMIDELAKKFRVIAPDMLGFGSSDSPEGYEIYSEENHAKRLLALMDELQIDHWNHVMHDAGGLWTWELMKLQPERIRKLVILNTIMYPSGFKPPIRFRKGLLARMVMWSYRNGVTTNAMLKGLFNSGLTKNNLTATDLEGYKTPLLEGKTRAMYYFFTQTCNSLSDYSEEIKKNKDRAAIIWGENDSFLLWEPQKEQVMKDLNLKEEAVHLLPARHFIQEEKPGEITAILLQFFSR